MHRFHFHNVSFPPFYLSSPHSSSSSPRKRGPRPTRAGRGSTYLVPAFAGMTTLAILLSPAHAADSDANTDTPTPELVVTATRVPTPVLDIPAGVSVIDRQTIEQRGYNTLAEALSAVPGIRVSQSGGAGGVASVFVRGTNSDQVLVLIDGMPMNDPSDPGAQFNFGVDTLGDVERIEIIRGPMAALYGSGAIGGVINLIMRTGHEQGFHVTGDLAGGYPAQVRGILNGSGIEGPLDYSLTFESQSQRGFDSTPQRMSIFTGVPQGFRDRLLTINLGYTPVDGTRVSLLLRGRSAKFGFNNLGDPTFDDANATGTDDTLLGRVGITSKLFNGTFETGVFVGRLQDDRQFRQLLNPLDVHNLASEDNRFHGYRTDIQWNNTVHLNDMFTSSVLTATDLTFGYEYIGDTANVKANSVSGGFPFAQNANASMTTNSGYAGIQTMLWQRLTLTGQVRQDVVLNDSPFTWRLGAVLDVPEVLTHFKAAYGTAFRAPTLFDRFGFDSTGFRGNPNLQPETAQGWEAGFTTDLPVFARADGISFGATYFNEQIQNLIVEQFVPIETQVNIGSAHIQGVETSLTMRLFSWMTLDATYTFTDAQDADDGERLLRRPQNTASLNATITPLPGLTIAPELLLTGAFQDFLIDNNGISTNVGTSQHGLIANLTVTYDVAPHVQLYATGRNIFNSGFEPVNGFQTPGGSFLAGVRVRL
jgi:vitamin B12 transporter